MILTRVFRLTPTDLPETPEARPAPSCRPRRAATAMEYLFALSLILVVAMAGIGYFGQQTKKVAESSGAAIQNATQQQQPATSP